MSDESPPPTAAEIRSLLRERLRDASDFDAFCHDHFRSEFQRFTNGMDRVARETLLLTHADAQAIVAAVARLAPAPRIHPQVAPLAEDDGINALLGLLPAQFELVLARLDAPIAVLSGMQAPLAIRAVELRRWAEQQNRRADLDAVVRSVTGRPVEARSPSLSVPEQDAGPRVRSRGAEPTLGAIDFLTITTLEERDTLLAGLPGTPALDRVPSAAPVILPGSVMRWLPVKGTDQTFSPTDHNYLPAQGPSPINPFYTAGTLPPNHPSYVARACDANLMEAFKSKHLIAIEGTYASGKSSMALRLHASLAVQRSSCYIDLQEVRTDEEHVFTREFFDRISQELGRKVDTWSVLGRRDGRPFALILDEFGLLAVPAPNFVPRLVQFAANHQDYVRVIVCLPVRSDTDSIQTLLAKFGVENQRYTRNWHRISVPPFDQASIEQVLGLLPARCQGVARENLDAVIRLSRCSPVAVQRLCSALFEAEADGLTDAEFKALVESEHAYE